MFPFSLNTLKMKEEGFCGKETRLLLHKVANKVLGDFWMTISVLPILLHKITTPQYYSLTRTRKLWFVSVLSHTWLCSGFWIYPLKSHLMGSGSYTDASDQTQVGYVQGKCLIHCITTLTSKTCIFFKIIFVPAWYNFFWLSNMET